MGVYLHLNLLTAWKILYLESGMEKLV